MLSSPSFFLQLFSFSGMNILQWKYDSNWRMFLREDHVHKTIYRIHNVKMNCIQHESMNGYNANGELVSSGIYFYCLQAEGRLKPARSWNWNKGFHETAAGFSSLTIPAVTPLTAEKWTLLAGINQCSNDISNLKCCQADGRPLVIPK